MAKTTFEITESGQIVRNTVYQEVLENPDPALEVLITGVGKEAPVKVIPKADPAVRCLHLLGEGVSAYRKKVNDKYFYWHAMMLETLNFHTDWELIDDKDATVNGGKPYLVPYIKENGGGELVDFGGPIPVKMPDDLIVHFVTEQKRSVTDVDLQLPGPKDITMAVNGLSQVPDRSYLTCFSKTRNTCLMMPLSNIYKDCRICIGGTYRDEILRAELHAGVVSSLKTYHKAWAQSKWNDHLLEGAHTDKTKRYKRFMRIDAETLEMLPFSGCEDWVVAAPIIPVEEIYEPWIK